MNLDAIIERTESLREQGRVFNPTHARSIITQIEWTVGVNSPERSNGGLDAIIELASQLRDEGRDIPAGHVRGIMQQIEWIVAGAGANRMRVRAPTVILPEEEVSANTIVCIDKIQFHALCTDACAICLETHTKGETVLTECNHEFGHQCWQQWLSASRSKSCPTCRKSRPSTTSFESN